MNRPRRHTVALALGLTLLAAACSSENTATAPAGSGDTSSTSSLPAESTTTMVAETSTTMPAESTTTAPPAPTTVPSPVTTAPGPAPTVAPPAGGGGVLGAPTNLRGVSVPSVVLPENFLCDGTDPGIPGWTVVDCQQMPSFQAGVTTLVARRVDDGRFGVFVLFLDGGSLTSLYEAQEPAPDTWMSVTVVLGDFHFDDAAEVWVGYRYAGTGQYLDLDVLDPRPEGPDFPATREVFLGGLQGLDHGQVDMRPGGATVLTPVYADSDPNCCPSSFMVREITWSAEQWRIGAGTTYPSATTPSVVSDF